MPEAGNSNTFKLGPRLALSCCKLCCSCSTWNTTRPLVAVSFLTTLCKLFNCRKRSSPVWTSTNPTRTLPRGKVSRRWCAWNPADRMAISTEVSLLPAIRSALARMASSSPALWRRWPVQRKNTYFFYVFKMEFPTSVRRSSVEIFDWSAFACKGWLSLSKCVRQMFLTFSCFFFPCLQQ